MTPSGIPIRHPREEWPYMRLSGPQREALRIYLVEPDVSHPGVRPNTERSLFDRGLISVSPANGRLRVITDKGHKTLAENLTGVRLRKRDLGGWHVHHGPTRLGWTCYSRDSALWVAYLRQEDKPMQGRPAGWDRSLPGICMFFEREVAGR